jgi:zinc protease
MAAYLTDTAYRSDTLTQVMASIGSMYASIESSPAGPITLASTRVLSGGDRRFGTATPAEFNALTIAEVRAWTEPQLKQGPIELSVVGDTTWGEASALVGSTLGALPRRQERAAVVSSQLLHPPQKPSRPVYLYTTDPKLRQVAIAWLCPVPDLSGVHMERRCRLLAAFLAERLRVRLREELGAAYGFEADFSQFDGFPDFSYFSLYTAVAPEHAQKANELIRSEIKALQHGRFSDDEFGRVKLPYLRTREADMRDNGFWGYTVLRDAQQRPERLAAVRDRQSDCAAIPRSDIEKLAARYFAYGRWFQFVAYPRASSPPPQAERPFGDKLQFGPPH